MGEANIEFRSMNVEIGGIINDLCKKKKKAYVSVVY